MQILKYALGLLLAATLVACGGGGGSAGTTSGGGGTTTPTTTTTVATPDSKVADFILYLDKSTIANGGSDKAQVTVIAIDASNNVVPGVTVKIKGDAGTVVTPAATVTDAAGMLVASVALGADKSNRQVGVDVTVNGITKSTAFAVIGTVLTVNPTPAVATPGQAVTLALTLRDSSGVTIPSSKITFSGDISAISGSFVVTTTGGAPAFVFTAPTTDGIYNITASGGGVSTLAQLRVSAGGGGSAVPAAIIPAGVTPSLAISPAVLTNNSVGSTANQSTLRALFLDASNVPIPNVRVRFSIDSIGGASSDSSIGTGVNTVYTSSSGTAFSTFIAGQNTSPTNGVLIKACYSAVDFTSSTDCPAFVTASMTVASQALGISIGEDVTLAKDVGIYKQQLAITVVDSAGRAVADAPVDISVDITHFGKGGFNQTITYSLSSSAINQAIPDLSTTPTAFGYRVFCPNEDTNRNGNVDLSENINQSVDTDGNATLEPRRGDISIAYSTPGVNKTDATGRLLVTVTYLQTVATWEVYRVRASTTVGGSQGTADRAFLTKFVEGDDASGGAPFQTPPYGVGACNQAF